MLSSSSRRVCLISSLVMLVAMLSQVALAIVPVDQNEQYTVRLPEFLPSAQAEKAMDVQSVTATKALASRYNGFWQVGARNTQTRSLHYVYGKSTPLGNRLRSEAQVEALARRVMADLPEIFAGKSEDLKLHSMPRARGKWAAHFQQTHKDLEVWQGKTLVVFDDESRVVLLGSDFYQDINLDTKPSLDRAMAEVIAREGVPFNPGTDSIKGDSELMILPVPVSASEVKHHLVYRIRVRTDDPLGEWVTHVDAHDGKILWRYNDIHFDHSGTTTSIVQEGTYCDGGQTKPMSYVDMDLDQGTLVTTDADGAWSVSGTSGEILVAAMLYGPYCRMHNFTGDDAFFLETIPEGSPFTAAFNNSNSQQDERDSFDGMSQLHDFFTELDPSFALAQTYMDVYVSRDDGYCPGNAWWDPSDGSINFCVRGWNNGTEYGNTGELQGVLFHEFGHGVQAAILGWQGNEGLGEGNADIMAILLTNDPALGRGFYIGDCANGLRDARNTLQYPDHVVGLPVHSAGKVMMGHHWKVQEHLMATYGEEEGINIAARNWHEGRILLEPVNQPDQVFAMFFIDDDDNDLTNGTPHFDAYCNASTIHGFDCPEVVIGVVFDHTPLVDTLDGSTAFPVVAAVISTEGDIDADRVDLVWRANGGAWSTTSMTATGSGDEFQGTIPALPAGLIEYYLTGEDIHGNTAVLPETAPADVFSFVVATSADPVEVAGDWTVGDTDDDATAGIWAHGDPMATTAQPEDDHSEDGVSCWITGLHAAGQTTGYSDVDGGKTTLFSPVYDLSTYDQASLRYWKWYTNDQGYSANEDYWDVSISNDGGSTWSVVEHTTVSTNAWVGMTVNVLDHFETIGQIQLKFTASDYDGGSLVEACVDDVMIIAYNTTVGVDDQLMAVRLMSLDQNRPNPFNPSTEISFNLVKSGPVKLGVYDVTGRLVKTLVQENMTAGAQIVRWNGVTNDGRPVATGVYFYRLEADGDVLSRRMLLLK